MPSSSNSGPRRRPLYLPANLPTIPHELESPVLYILDTIHVRWALKQADRFGFVPLNAKTLKGVCWNYSPAMQWLLDTGVVECVRRYVPGEKSRGYRWAGGGGIAERPCPKALAARLHVLEIRKQAALAPVHRHLRQWLDRVEIDMPAAEALVRSMPKRGRRMMLTVAQLIHYREWEFSVCSFGRVHSPITRLGAGPK